MAETIQDIISGGSIKLIVISFVLGGIWFNFQDMNNRLNNIESHLKEIESHKASNIELQTVEGRLDKKIKVINSIDNRLRKIECNR